MAVLRSNVMSRKSTTFLLASMVIYKLLCLKVPHICFCIASTCLGNFVQVASPSSLYNPTLTSRWVSWDNKNSPTSWQVSVHKYVYDYVVLLSCYKPLQGICYKCHANHIDKNYILVIHLFNLMQIIMGFFFS